MNKRIKVWDLPIRLFHWTLVAAIFYSWFSIEILEDMQQHFYSGYVVLTLILFRLVWGILGTAYSRFSALFLSPSKIVRYTKALMKPNNQRYLGHNPLGSVSVVVMIFLLLAQAALGLFSSDDYYFGPLSGLVDEQLISQASYLHSLNSEVVFYIIGLHIVAILFYKFFKHDALTKAMITGTKVISNGVEYLDQKAVKPANKWLVVFILGLCIALVYWLATAFLDRLPTSTESYY